MQEVKFSSVTGVLRKLRRFDWRRVVGFVGTTLIVVGLLILGLIAYQLWGTGIQTREAQRGLKSDFNAMVASTTTTVATHTTEPIEIPTPDEGEVIAYMHVEKMALDVFVVQGVKYQDLRIGPGHYPTTPMIGEPGNASIAGHRTTYDAPFGNIDKLEVGDEISFETAYGNFTYVVDGNKIVEPTDVSVIATTNPSVATLTLTSCHPKWSSDKRYVVTATLKEKESTPVTVVSKPPTTTPEPAAPDEAFAEGWWHDSAAWPDVIFWTVALLVLIALVFVAKRRFTGKVKRAHWIAAAIVVAPFLICLYFFYENLSRLLPTNL